MTGAAEDGRRRAALRGARAVVVEDDEGQEPTTNAGAAVDEALVPGVSVLRLRATAGGFTWPSITEHLQDCHVLVFDLTPNKRFEDTDKLFVSPNIWLELGYALRTGKRVYLVHEHKKGFASLPSDLKGFQMGCIPADGGQADTSLRMSLVGTIRRLLLERATDALTLNQEVNS